jgi:hypothetical protein
MSEARPWQSGAQRGLRRLSVGKFSLRPWVAVTLTVCLLAASPLAWSYFRALTVPGGGSLGVRSVDWLRQIGLSREVGILENLWYSHHPPPTGGAPPRGLNAGAVGPGAVPPSGAVGPGAVPPSGAVGPGALAPVAAVTPIASPALPGEGHWRPIGGLVNGTPAMYATYLRPDTVHTSLTAAIVRIDPTLAALHLVAGSVEPGGTGWPVTAPVSTAIRQQLLAAFNSGFRRAGSLGGYYDAGQTARPLVSGAASLLIMQDGTATVVQWGRDVTMTATVASVRQNLSLIIDGGQITQGVYQNSSRSWGSTVGNQVLVWRSGIGVTASGALVYAAGPGLSIVSLATLLQHAGAIRAMELDINSAWVGFTSFNVPAGGMADATNGSLLLPGMAGGVGRYLGPDTRDFLALVAR